jgi:hypothetical protein
MSKGFSINIYLPDGDPDGLRIVGKSHWTGKGLVIPRARLKDFRDHPELQGAGIYVLTSPSAEGDLPIIYVGQGEPVGACLDADIRDKDFWSWVIVFVSSDGSIRHSQVEHMQSRLVQVANQSRRTRVHNPEVPLPPRLSETQLADAESFLEDILSIYPVIGISAFQPAPTPPVKQRLLSIRSQGVRATGYEAPEGFVIIAGSEAANEENRRVSQSLSRLRWVLRENGVLIQKGTSLIFDQNYPFSSPSTAAGVVLGRAANGGAEWKDPLGRTLQVLREG